MRRQGSARDVLTGEIGAVTGTVCGHRCDHHDGLTCARAAGHVGAEIVTDRHVGVVGGEPVVFGDECCGVST